MAEFRMPSLGADMEAGTLVEWRVEPGDAVDARRDRRRGGDREGHRSRSRSGRTGVVEALARGAGDEGAGRDAVLRDCVREARAPR